MDANKFATYAASLTGSVATDDEPEQAGPHDHDTCPNPLDRDNPTHTWVSRSYEPRQHCDCGTLRHPDPARPSRHKP